MDHPNAPEVVKQARRMIDVADARHPGLVEICRTNPMRVADMWRDDVLIEFVDDGVNGSGRLGPDGVPATCHMETGDGRPVLRVFRYRAKSRTYFSLLHELGHYLQRTDPGLAVALLGQDAEAGIDFEERACDAFASRVLLPDALVSDVIERCGGVNAYAACTLAENSMASRSCVAKRLVDIMPNPGMIAVYGAWKGMFCVTTGGFPPYEPETPLARYYDRIHDYMDQRYLLWHARRAERFDLTPGDLPVDLRDGAPARMSMCFQRVGGRYQCFMVFEDGLRGTAG
ncbi:ImmA/IrrE family metallo-endopeptidase [Bifidobacterium catulorum]|uniref:IrrE N-terminal-like domain-containing protein n=1 Tax=Bifidobacterium catulorum TaxID=1630173 RepID=A0A2U2MTU7_9BIFI|nr:ImmA/IrrE family metallo-endopeptidase [Bifidobacterium catulorum]PWG60281.1 hypothetical protein DF200_03515 [Bifidobacterium catulorum]